jgi:hypothetical protein
MPPKKRNKSSAVVDDNDEYEPEPSNAASKAKRAAAKTSRFPLATTLVQDAKNNAVDLIASAEREDVRLDVLKHALSQLCNAIDAADRLNHQRQCGGCKTTDFASGGTVCVCGMAKYCGTCAQEESQKCADPYACSNLICNRSKCSSICDFCNKVHCSGCLKETKCYRKMVCYACRIENNGCSCGTCLRSGGFSSDDG